MAERSYGLVVEGTYDEPVFRELISRILSDAEVKIEVYTCGGKTKLLRKFPDYLKIFQHAAEGYPLDKALVIIDGDGRNPSELKEKMAGKISGRCYRFRDGVHLCVVQRQAPAWLLADLEAINSLAKERGGKRVDPTIREAPEEITDPKDRLRRLLACANLHVTPQVYGEIARRTNLDRLRELCPSFRDFEQAVMDC